MNHETAAVHFVFSIVHRRVPLHFVRQYPLNEASVIFAIDLIILRTVLLRNEKLENFYFSCPVIMLTVIYIDAIRKIFTGFLFLPTIYNSHEE